MLAPSSSLLPAVRLPPRGIRLHEEPLRAVAGEVNLSLGIAIGDLAQMPRCPSDNMEEAFWDGLC